MLSFDFANSNQSAFGGVRLSLLDKTGQECHAGDFEEVLKTEANLRVGEAVVVLARAWLDAVGRDAKIPKVSPRSPFTVEHVSIYVVYSTCLGKCGDGQSRCHGSPLSSDR